MTTKLRGRPGQPAEAEHGRHNPDHHSRVLFGGGGGDYGYTYYGGPGLGGGLLGTILIVLIVVWSVRR